MTRAWPFVAALAVTSGVAHFLVIGPRNLATLVPAQTYGGASQRLVLYAEQLWSHSRGGPSMLDCRKAVERTDAAAGHTHPAKVTVSYLDPGSGEQRQQALEVAEPDDPA